MMTLGRLSWLAEWTLPLVQPLPLTAHMLLRGEHSACGSLPCEGALTPIAVRGWRALADKVRGLCPTGSAVRRSEPDHAGLGLCREDTALPGVHGEERKVAEG